MSEPEKKNISTLEAFEKVCDALMPLDKDEAVRVLRAAAILCGIDDALQEKGRS